MPRPKTGDKRAAILRAATKTNLLFAPVVVDFKIALLQVFDRPTLLVIGDEGDVDQARGGA
jgi:hypothetical protein